MELTEGRIGEATMLRVVGRVDGSVSKLLEQKVADVTRRATASSSSTWREMSYVSSAGLRPFITLAKHAQAKRPDRLAVRHARRNRRDIRYQRTVGTVRRTRHRGGRDRRVAAVTRKIACPSPCSNAPRCARRRSQGCSSRPMRGRAASAPGSFSTSSCFAAYSVAGLVVVLFGIGPAKISPIYPPAGIAVAATFSARAAHPARGLPRAIPATAFRCLSLPQTTLTMYALANSGTGVGSILEALIALGALLRRSPARGIRSTAPATSSSSCSARASRRLLPAARSARCRCGPSASCPMTSSTKPS